MKPLKAFAVCKLSETVPHARCRQHRFPPSLLVRHGVGKCPRFGSKLPIPLCPTLHSMMTFTTWDQVTLVQVFQRPCDQPMSSEATV